MSGTWELFAWNGKSTLLTKCNLKKKTSPTEHPQEKKVRPLHSMARLLIGCMKIIFLKLAATIFGLD
jgi:hypothetical protein